MNGSVADVGNGEQHVIGKFALDARAPHLNISVRAWIFGELVQGACAVEGRRTESSQRRRPKRVIVPDPVRGNVGAVRVYLDLTGGKATIVHGQFIVSKFIRALVQEVDRVTRQEDSLWRQLVSEANARTEVFPVDIGPAVSGAARAGAKLPCSP